MKTKSRTVFFSLLITGCILLTILILAVIGLWLYLTYGIDSSLDKITLLSQNEGTPSKLYAINSDGSLIPYGEGQISLGTNYDYASIDTIPDDLINAFIAIEDKRFYDHIGFDYITTTKAVFKYIFSKGGSPGGSTITQQLIKNLTGNDEISIKRKLTEILMAVKLEKIMSKNEILELYLNSIYLSQGTYGVSAAAKLYFNKEVSELTLIESAAIAAITQAPTKWDPILNPENNAYRRNIILKEMYKSGKIDSQAFNEAHEQTLELTPCYDNIAIQTSSWYTDAVINEAITLLESSLNVSRKVAEHHIFRGGYQIIVAVNPTLQEYLEQVYLNETLFSTDMAQSSFVILDAQNGNVLALVGGVGEKTASRVLNRATQTIRSPGSAIKPLSVYLPAIEKGVLTYSTVIDDIPLYFDNNYDKSGWPKNANGLYQGLVNIEKAIASSLNTASVTLLEKVGLEYAHQFLKEELGISTLTDNDFGLSALALGGMEKGTTLLETTAAYTPLANSGIYSGARCVISIVDNGGNTIVDNQPKQKVVCSEESTQILTKLLQNVITRSDGTAYNAVSKLLNYSEAAGKTGTTSYNYDRWFIGYTPLCVGGIWLGYDEQQSLENINGKAHIRIWDDIMAKAHQILNASTTKTTFSDDCLIETKFCIYSGKLAAESCYLDPRQNAIDVGYFTRDTIPTEYCATHVSIKYCQAGKGVAGNACPNESLTSVGLLLISRSFPIPITIQDSEYTAMTLPEEYTPFIDLKEPYYKYYVPHSINIGNSGNNAVFNRFCQLHPPTLDANSTPSD